jgi:hypothetical protein
MEGNILFVHAGLDPTAEPSEFLNQSRFGAVNECHWAWIREPFLEWTGGWGDCKKWIVVPLVIHGRLEPMLAENIARIGLAEGPKNTKGAPQDAAENRDPKGA